MWWPEHISKVLLKLIDKGRRWQFIAALGVLLLPVILGSVVTVVLLHR